MLKMMVVISYVLSIIYIIEKDSLKLVIMAFNEVVDSVFSNIFIYEFRN